MITARMNGIEQVIFFLDFFMQVKCGVYPIWMNFSLYFLYPSLYIRNKIIQQ